MARSTGRQKPETVPAYTLGEEIHKALRNATRRNLSFADQCRELTVRNKEGALVPFIWNHVQHEYDRIRAGKQRTILLKYRRGGFSTLEQARAYTRAKNEKEFRHLFAADTSENSSIIFEVFQRFYREDPCKPTLLCPPSSSRFRYANGSTVRIATAGSKTLGQGDTLSSFHGSEVATWCKDVTADDKGFRAVEGIISDVTEACSHGEAVLESTPDGVDNWFYKTWQTPKSWFKVFIPWFNDPTNRIRETDRATLFLGGLSKDQQETFIATVGPFLKDGDILSTLAEDEKILIEKQGLDLEQLAWRRWKKFDRGDLFVQEYPEDDTTCFLLTGNPLYDTLRIAREILAAPTAIRETHDERVFAEPVTGLRYFIGADIATGEGGDWCAASVRDEHGFQAATIRSKDSPEDFGRRLDKLGRRYNLAFIKPESNSIGRSTINTLMNECLYPKVSAMEKWNGSYMVLTHNYGWETTPVTRPRMLTEHRDAWLSGDWPVNCRWQLNEMRNFVKKRGRWEGDPNDDLVFADAIALQCRNQELAAMNHDFRG